MAKKAEHKGIYIDPLTDFGFKRLFGVYYGSRLIQEQSKRGKDWDFTLPPVYLVNIVCAQILAEISTIAVGHAYRNIYETV